MQSLTTLIWTALIHESDPSKASLSAAEVSVLLDARPVKVGRAPTDLEDLLVGGLEEAVTDGTCTYDVHSA